MSPGGCLPGALAFRGSCWRGHRRHPQPVLSGGAGGGALPRWERGRRVKRWSSPLPAYFVVDAVFTNAQDGHTQNSPAS